MCMCVFVSKRSSNISFKKRIVLISFCAWIWKIFLVQFFPHRISKKSHFYSISTSPFVEIRNFHKIELKILRKTRNKCKIVESDNKDGGQGAHQRVMH